MGNIKTISVSQTKHHMKSIFLKISIMAAIFVISSSFVIDHMNPAEEQQPDKKATLVKWIKRVGVWGFLFFLIKGLVWLALGWWVFK